MKKTSEKMKGTGMMEERRTSKRLELTVTLKLEYIHGQTQKAEKNVTIEVLDLSSKGIGFRSKEKLDVEGFYDTKMIIWTKEVIPCVMQIIREVSEADGIYHYGAVFVGMSEINQQKIDTYQMIDEIEKEGRG